MSDQPSVMQDIDYAKVILNYNQTLIHFVDTKAGVLLAVDGAVLAILATKATAVAGFEELALGATLLLVGVSAFLGFLIIMPRVHGTHPNTKIFYTAIISQTREAYKEGFSSTSKEMLDDYLNNIYTLALIQEKKFLYLQSALACLFMGLVPLIAVIVAVH